MKNKILEGKKHIIFLKDQSIYKSKNKPNKAIFFDRDGVLIKDMHYIKDSKYVSLMKGAKEILNYTNNLGYLNIVITNQSGISRNFFTWEDYESVTNRMLAMINIPEIIIVCRGYIKTIYRPYTNRSINSTNRLTPAIRTDTIIRYHRPLLKNSFII